MHIIDLNVDTVACDCESFMQFRLFFRHIIFLFEQQDLEPAKYIKTLNKRWLKEDLNKINLDTKQNDNVSVDALKITNNIIKFAEFNQDSLATSNNYLNLIMNQLLSINNHIIEKNDTPLLLEITKLFNSTKKKLGVTTYGKVLVNEHPTGRAKEQRRNRKPLYKYKNASTTDNLLKLNASSKLIKKAIIVKNKNSKNKSAKKTKKQLLAEKNNTLSKRFE